MSKKAKRPTRITKIDQLIPKYPKIVLKDVAYSDRYMLNQFFQKEMGITFEDSVYLKAANVRGLSKLVYRKENEEDDEEFIGGVFCCVVKHSIYVLAMARKQKYHKEGIGRKMMGHIFDCVEHNKCYKDIWLHVATVNQNAIGFYEHYNFVKTRKEEDYYSFTGKPEWKDAYVYEIQREAVVSTFRKIK